METVQTAAEFLQGPDAKEIVADSQQKDIVADSPQRRQKDIVEDSPLRIMSLDNELLIKDLQADLAQSEAQTADLQFQLSRTKDDVERQRLALAGSHREKAELSKQVKSGQEELGLERQRTDSVQAALDDQKKFTAELQEEIRLLSGRLREMVEERILFAEKLMVRGDDALPSLDWEPPALSDGDQGDTPIIDLSTFLGGSPASAVRQHASSGDSAPGTSISSSPSGSPASIQAPDTAPKPGGFGAWLAGSAQAALTKAFGTRPSREEEFKQMLTDLTDVPPTRHVLRGPTSNAVERLRLTVASPNLETAGTPESARGALWSSAVGNRLYISEAQYGRVSRKRDGLRTVWSEMDARYTKSTLVGEAGNEDFQTRQRQVTAKTLFSQADSDLARGIETEELYQIGAALEQIPLDVTRTLSCRDVATLDRPGPSADEVRDLLEAFAVLKPEFGYTQGMNFLAAIFLIHLDAVQAFVCFTNAVMLQPWLAACYTFNMPVVQRYFDVFDELLFVYVPRVGRHFQQLGLTSDLILVEWWFALFARSLPLPVVVRLWDLFFLEGDFLLYRASLAILQCFSEALVARPRDECLALLSTWPAKRLDAAQLFDTMDRMGFSDKKLSSAFERVQSRPTKTSPG